MILTELDAYIIFLVDQFKFKLKIYHQYTKYTHTISHQRFFFLLYEP